jgi:hypothetical protein
MFISHSSLALVAQDRLLGALDIPEQQVNDLHLERLPGEVKQAL